MQSQKNNRFEILQMPPQNTNSVVVSSGTDCIIFDPWGRARDWERALMERGLQLRAIYVTHGHPDHIAAAPALAHAFNVPWYMSDKDNGLIGWGNELLEYFGLSPIKGNIVPPTNIAPGRTTVLGEIAMDVIECPGHTPGGLAYYFPGDKILITGDTIFENGFGRYDFPGGDQATLFQSIANLYNLNLGDETYVVHGHGMDSTIKSLKEKNPYFRG